ncbi:uncharacterized protein METZ01_LOCUS291378 [marine metagenome]|jgi:hypothetical protein|uniref:Uncharacterized protein n=1 Tax=marine metagenome TaxID=408172 RepID=A0A382LNZ3_9ZZZZ
MKRIIIISLCSVLTPFIIISSKAIEDSVLYSTDIDFVIGDENALITTIEYSF